MWTVCLLGQGMGGQVGCHSWVLCGVTSSSLYRCLSSHETHPMLNTQEIAFGLLSALVEQAALLQILTV